MFGIVGAYHISTTGKIWKLRLWSSEKSGSIFTVTNAQKTGKKVRSAFILSVTATVQLNLDSVIYACYPIFERQALENLPYFQMPTVIHLCYIQVHHRRKLHAVVGTVRNVVRNVVRNLKFHFGWVCSPKVHSSEKILLLLILCHLGA